MAERNKTHEELQEVKHAVGLDERGPNLKEIREVDDPDNRGERVDDED